MEASADPITGITADADGNVEASVLKRYAAGAEHVEADLCCPTNGYDAQYLRLLPQEILEKDYGCGDPSRYVQPGETVVDLGSGVGKICYILAQRVGAAGRVIGLDFNDAMLDVARKYLDEMARAFGYRNVEFHKARIQDMAVDLESVQRWLDERPIGSLEQVSQFEAFCDRLRREEPLIADASVDAVVSNCVLNLVRSEDKRRLFGEIHRVLRDGGRAVISDIVCDEDVPPEIRSDQTLWSGCIAGAFREDEFLELFEQAGFYGVEILSRAAAPWRVIDGIEFRAMTVRAFKGDCGPCLERNQAVIYRGPWKQVRDDDGHVLQRGRRMAVCDKTYRRLTDRSGPYVESIVPVPPIDDVPVEQATAFRCAGAALRPPRDTKRGDVRPNVARAESPCCPDAERCPPKQQNGESGAC